MSVSQPNPDGPLIDWFLSHRYGSSKETTRRSATSSLNQFREFIESEEVAVTEVDEEYSMRFIQNFMQDQRGYSPKRQQNLIYYVSEFYDHCLEYNIDDIDGNPISKVVNEHDPLDPVRENEPYLIDNDEMSRFISSFDNPRFLLPILIMAKSTKRVGAVVNLDLYDVSIDHPACDWKVNDELRRWDDYFYISPEPEKGEEFRGMERMSSNKTNTKRIIPIDNELKQAILWYLSIRKEPTDPMSPLLLSDNVETLRLRKNRIYAQITSKAKELGHWYEPYHKDNITPHYFRHWATSILRDRMERNSGLVTHLRGDTGENMTDHYTHWTKEKEKKYLDIVPKFFD